MARLLPILLFLTGCAPNYMTAAAVHASQPMYGRHAPPIGGDHEETGYNGLEFGLRWEQGPYWAETNMDYMITSRNVAGGPWMFFAKAGVRVEL